MIVITTSADQIGRQLVTRLLNAEAAVRVIVRPTFHASTP